MGEILVNDNVKLNKDLGFLRIGAANPQLRVADIDFNIAAIIDTMKKARDRGVQVLAFPEMAITGYTIGDLIQQHALLLKAQQGLNEILKESQPGGMLVIVGIPLAAEQKIFNCAVALSSGHILGIIPKTLLPNYREFYEGRWFSSSTEARSKTLEIDGQEIPFGTDILFKLRGIEAGVIGVEVCEDLWVPLAPHEYQALAGATVLVNLSASNEILGKADWRRTMISSESGRCIAGYCYVSSGIGESSNDIVYSSHSIIAENGVILKESERMAAGPQLIISDIDLERLIHDRATQTSYRAASTQTKTYRTVEVEISDEQPETMERTLDPHPFVPREESKRAERCRDIFSMQVAALAQKLNGSRKKKLVIGVSGGLDSTLALLAGVKTMDFLSLPRTNVFAFNMPGFGTTQKTKNNAARLCWSLGVSFKQVNITKSAVQHLKDLDHNGNKDVVYENVQARYRTDFLFNKANQIDAIVLGTGNLTEVALGWSTFSGDQLSHYHINVSVPKTLVKFLVDWVADEEITDSKAVKVLHDILNTPFSPELLPPVKGEIVQKSEEFIGPVELADFYLYPFIRFGIRPGKILFLANEVNKQGLFDNRYTVEDLYKWLKSFINRFFANQFKRTCIPEGPKVGAVSLSPRGDWRMPSDAEAKLWLEDLEAMYKRLA
jgi:NAD+ synthase (glutamine-hydrolysing)